MSDQLEADLTYSSYVEDFHVTLSSKTQLYHEYTTVNSSEFLVPRKTLEIMNKFKAFGFLDAHGSRINFSHLQDLKQNRTRFTIEFTKYNLLVHCISVDTIKETVWVYGMNPETLKIDDFFSSIPKRFTRFDFTPVNGWEFIYVIDFRNLCLGKWTEKRIKELDELKTLGLNMNAVPFLLERRIPFKQMKNLIGVPEAWIYKAYAEVKPQGEKVFRHGA